jgi:hypothetical protein
MLRLPFFTLLALSFSFLLAALSSCGKRDFIQTKSNYAFTNNMDRAVTLDFYDNADDYYGAKNSIKRLQIPVGSSTPVELDAMRSYWVDWYSADYSMNNWAVDSNGYQNNLPSAELRVAAEDDEIGISSSMEDVSRWVLLSGNELSSNWKVDIDGTQALNGSHQFTFRRDYTGEYIFTPKVGAATVMPINYSLFSVRADYFRMKVKDSDGDQIAEIYFNSNPNSYPNFGRDTLMVNFRMVSYYDYYAAKRQ